MKDYLDGLLISEVAVVSGAAPENIKNWIKHGLVSAPPIVGKHRRFSAQDTLEVILMEKLISRGVKPSVAGSVAVSSAPTILFHYDWPEQRDNVNVDTYNSWLLVIDLEKGASAASRRNAVRRLIGAGDLLVIGLESVMNAALTRALDVRKRRGE